MNRPTIVGILRGAKKLLRNKNNHIRGFFELGDKVCLVGAARKVAGVGNFYQTVPPQYFSAVSLLDQAARSLGYHRATDANDNGGYTVAMKVLRKALKRAER